jgi:hypothetical protein
MSWSSSRQLIILLLIIAVLGGIGSVFAYPLVFKAPTCTDGKHNGTEAGIDCGGPCEKLCSAALAPIETLWSRPFKVAPGVYDAFAYVENKNFDAGVRKILYRFSLYDQQNLLVTERVGKTFITPNGRIPIFEGGIRTGERVPKRAFFEFAEVPLWEPLSPKAASLTLTPSAIRLENASSTPRLSVIIGNKGIYTLSNVEVTAVLYDEGDNAFAVSRTIIDSLPKGGSAEASFTWLTPFAHAPARIEVVPRVDSFSIPF